MNMMDPPWMTQGYIKRVYFISQKSSKSQLLNSIPFYSRCDNPFPLTGTGMENCIPKFWERESKKHSQLLGTGTGMKNSFPNVGNGNRRPVFQKMVGNGNFRSSLTYKKNYTNISVISLTFRKSA